MTHRGRGHAPAAEPGRGYPRPQLRRAEWISLDGPWSFALDPDARWSLPTEVAWEGDIEVPFTPETPRSGVRQNGLYRACWYERTFAAPSLGGDDRLLLHFGAVDHRATVWIDGELAGVHEGGYTPFTIDVTPWARAPGEHTIAVRAEDEPDDLAIHHRRDAVGARPW
jgi:beta-galactosidase/beta-glucuronidase